MVLPSLFQLLNPLMMLVFAGGFAAIYRYDRNAHRSALFFSLNYFCAALGFVVDFFRSFIPLIAASYMSNSLYLASMVLFCLGMCTRYARPAPAWALAAICVATLSVNSWFLLLSPNISARSLTMSFGAAAIAGLAAWTIRSAVSQRIDRIIHLITIAFAGQFIIRPLIVIGLTGASMTPENYLTSAYAVTLHFAMAVIGLSVAGALFVAYGMDIVSKLNQRGDTDHLSGILNRRGFEAHARALVRSQSGGAIEAAIVVCDIDHFKSVNDSHGHATGDAVIAHLASVIRRLCPPDGACGRIGGEEFSVLLLRSTPDMARLWCEGIRAALVEESGANGLPAYTASFGVSGVRSNQTIDMAQKDADNALYSAKRAGRDCVRVSEHVTASANAAFPFGHAAAS
jgi:diguanylate cyclase (GGDEF)-like protein